MRSFRIYIALLPGLWAAVCCQGTAAVHPLDPLNAEEIARTAQLLRDSGKVDAESRFAMIHLHEPPKSAVLHPAPGAPPPREAFAVIFQKSSNHTYEAVVDLSARRLSSWTEIPGAQPALLGADAMVAEQVVRADPRWREAMRKRGITDLRNVQVTLWSPGYFGLPEEQGIRLGKALTYYRGQAENFYARPIEGVTAWVNLNRGTVIKLEDTGQVPISREVAELDPRSIGKQRPALRSLEIVQPDGPEFALRQGEIEWQNWSFRFAVDPREGLVLYLVRYADEGRVRPVMYRASLSEMVVPYGDPAPGWYFRSPFDVGELGLGSSLTPLRRGLDVPENAVFQNALVADEGGAAREIPRAVGIYERDGGVLWKWRNEARRSRQLVIATNAHLGNYDYRFNWVFQQDGSIAMEIFLTGIMTVKGVANSANHDESMYGHAVAPGLVAVHHQHFFNFRLDMDVDGDTDNCVVEMNTESAPKGPANPFGNAFTMKETTLRTEKDAQRKLNLASSRRWTVTHCAQKNALGGPVGYTLLPGENAQPFAAPDSWLLRRAGFLNAHLWVTPYQAAERYAAGDYPNQSHGGDGLPRWTHANRPVENQDIVLWYTLGVTHVPRPEEWPVMPVHQTGFRLVPNGFFTRNPALDVPR